MNDRDGSTVLRWARTFGWSNSLTSKYGMFRRGSHYIIVAWDGQDVGGNIAFRTTGPDQAEPDYAQYLNTVYEWFATPAFLDRWVSPPPSPRPRPRPRPPAPPVEPAPPLERPTARFREMEF